MLIRLPTIVQFPPGCIGLLAALIFLSNGPTRAANDLSFKIRLQPRLDVGPIARSADGSDYLSTQDASLRRVRLEIVGRPRDGLRYIVAFAADRWDQRGRNPSVILCYALANYRFTPALNLQFGLAKLPYSRGLLASSSRLMLPERAASADLAGRFFKFFAPHLVLHGRLAAGAIAYHLTLSDGLQPGDSDRAFSGQTVAQAGDPVTALRVEFSPPDWIEKRMGNAHLGQGQHLTLGLNAVRQTDLKLTNLAPESRLLLGADLSFHQQNLSLAAEYLRLQRDNAIEITTTGWYAQAGYYFSSRRLEPALRFGQIDKGLPNSSTRIFTTALNWYIEAHSFKFQIALTHHKFDQNAREVTDKDSKTTLLIQNQIYF